MKYNGKEVEVLRTSPDGSESRIKYVGQEDYTAFSISTKKLKGDKKPRLTGVQRASQNDPTILDLIWGQYQNGGRLLISCQASRIDPLANQLSQITVLSETEAVDYISAASEKTHAMKFYVILPAIADETFYTRVSNFFGSRTILTSTTEVQYNSRSLAEWLMKEHSVLPEKRY
jgi:hypothetical protein